MPNWGIHSNQHEQLPPIWEETPIGFSGQHSVWVGRLRVDTELVGNTVRV
jgi:hypothetical protein